MDSDNKIEELKKLAWDLDGEIQVLLDTLQEIYSLSSRGKTKELADLIRTTLTHYNKQ
jgi:hypothetical protein